MKHLLVSFYHFGKSKQLFVLYFFLLVALQRRRSWISVSCSVIGLNHKGDLMLMTYFSQYVSCYVTTAPTFEWNTAQLAMAHIVQVYLIKRLLAVKNPFRC